MSSSSTDRSIAAVERETGLTKDTLRVWEKRYGFPQPLRDAAGNRRYPVEQVEKLRLIRRLLDAGQRPSKVVGLELSALQAYLAEVSGADQPQPRSSTPATGQGTAQLEPYLQAVSMHNAILLQRMLIRAQLRMGLASFIQDLVAPLTTAVGDAWAQRRFEVFEEHFYTEVLTRVLRQAIANLPPPRGARPVVLLTTLPDEMHGLGLLMVEALLALENCRCISLGTQTPLGDIVQAARAHKADIVALSCTNVLSSPFVLDCLQQLERQLPANVEIWAGGSCAALHQAPINGVKTFDSLQPLAQELVRWRQQYGCEHLNPTAPGLYDDWGAPASGSPR